jgi:hypothetical protein
MNDGIYCLLKKLAGTTRLELATSAVTGQRSNQLNYVPSFLHSGQDDPGLAESLMAVATLPATRAETRRASVRHGGNENPTARSAVTAP